MRASRRSYRLSNPDGSALIEDPFSRLARGARRRPLGSARRTLQEIEITSPDGNRGGTDRADRRRQPARIRCIVECVEDWLVPYDLRWPQAFDDRRAELEPALAPWLHGGIHHIGSTSIPGLVSCV